MRVVIDAMLVNHGRGTTNPNTMRFEGVMPDSICADFTLCDRKGRSLRILEAKRYSVDPADAAGQANSYAQHLDVHCEFLTIGNEVLFADGDNVLIDPVAHLLWLRNHRILRGVSSAERAPRRMVTRRSLD